MSTGVYHASVCVVTASGDLTCLAGGDASGGMTACAAKADGATTCWGLGDFVVNGAPSQAVTGRRTKPK